MRDRILYSLPLVLAAGVAVALFSDRQASVASVPGTSEVSTVAGASSAVGLPENHAGSTEHVDARIHALEMWAEAGRQDPDSLLHLARLLHDSHRPDAAADAYRHYLDARPQDRQAWLDLANALAAAGRWDEALEASKALLDVTPGDPAALYNLGAVHATLGRLEEARIAWHRVAVSSDPDLSRLAAASLKRLRETDPGR